MNTVVAFPTESVRLKKARTDNKLVLTQAVIALESELGIKISPKTLEKWEGRGTAAVDARDARKAYEAFCRSAEAVSKSGKNLLFGSIPVAVAREILELSQEEIGRLFDYSASSWAKIEANSRFLPEKKLVKLEAMLQDRFLDFCGNGQRA